MRIAIIAVVVLGALIVLVLVVGWSLPVRHRVSRRATFAASPESVYDAITNVGDFQVALDGEERRGGGGH